MQIAFDALMYPFLFLTLYFEVFAILTFFDREAKRRRTLKKSDTFPSVSVIVPCFNEEKTLRDTVSSLLGLDYPKEQLSIVLVNDGSTDATRQVMDEYANHPHIKLMHQKNSGKHTALNAGINASRSEYIACLDADSFVAPNALRESVAHFDGPRIGAVTASISVYEPTGMVEKMQQAEYALGIVLRHILSIMNGLYVTPGPFTVYRRDVFEKVGPFRAAHQTEDMEIALRMQRSGWHIHNAPRAVVYTKAPATFSLLIKQRIRWTTGFMRNCIDNRDIFGNPIYGVLGLLVLPFNFILIFFGIALFIVGMLRLGENLWQWLIHTSQLPLTELLHFPSLNWFFAPVSAIALLLLIAMTFAFGLMYVGAKISKISNPMMLPIVWFALLYGLVAPFWLMRAALDVALDIKRSWR